MTLALCVMHGSIKTNIFIILSHLQLGNDIQPFHELKEEEGVTEGKLIEEGS